MRDGQTARSGRWIVTPRRRIAKSLQNERSVVRAFLLANGLLLAYYEKTPIGKFPMGVSIKSFKINELFHRGDWI